ncbi:MAG: hypothetical protein ACTIAG_00150 [Lactobacillus sp.]|nr:hypothetical protein [Lactobacillus sp.]MDN6052291.1 hypothetical protein [Lactobacillus sp.]
MKRHLILLGPQGLIYYSWLFTILLIGIILGYEGNQLISIPALVCSLIFILLLIWTIRASYLIPKSGKLHLPYRRLPMLSVPLIQYRTGRYFIYYQARVNHYQTIKLAILKSKPANR